MEKKIPPKIVIPGMLTTLNGYIEAERASRYMAAELKKTETAYVESVMRDEYPLPDEKLDYEFHWYWKDRRTDPDNIFFSIKFIFDGMQGANIIQGDGWKQVGKVTHECFVDKENPRVEIFVSERD